MKNNGITNSKIRYKTSIDSTKSMETVSATYQVQLDKTLKDAEEEAIDMLRRTKDSITELSKIRSSHKMSNSRVAGVARELNELIKVMSVYTRPTGYQHQSTSI